MVDSHRDVGASPRRTFERTSRVGAGAEGEHDRELLAILAAVAVRFRLLTATRSGRSL